MAKSSRMEVTHAGDLAELAEDAVVLPASAAQRRLWFLHRLQPDDTYNLGVAARITGALDVEGLREALRRLVQRHEPLRTTLRPVDGELVQVVAAEARPPVRLLRAASDAEAERLAGEVVAAVFPMERDPAFRAAVVRSAPDRHLLVLAVHHAFVDGRSLGVLSRDLGALYAGLAPPEPELQHGDYAAWEERWLDTPAAAAQLARWRAHLAGAPTILEIPLARPRPARQRHRGGSVPVTVPPALAAALRRRCREERATLFTGLAAAFAALLSRLSGQRTLLLGTPTSGRSDPRLEDAVGPFVNTVVLRLDAGAGSFRDLLRGARREVEFIQANAELPFDRLVDALRAPRDLSRQPVFQAMLSLEPRSAPPALPGLRVEPVELPHATTMFDLTLVLREEGEAIVGRLEYDADLYDRPAAARLAGGLLALLAAAAAEPDRRLEDLPVVPPDEERWIVAAAAGVVRPAPRATTAETILGRARRTPDLPAVRAPDGDLTYGALADRAARIAAALHRAGVRRGDAVGVELERCADLAPCLLGVWMAGAAYVPLDPEYPEARLAHMRADAGVRLVVTSGWLAESVGHAPLAALAPEPGMDDLAYVLYTSGTTGLPKGVEVTHGALANLLADMADMLSLAPGDRVAGLTSLSFDIAAVELIAPLAAGAEVVLYDRRVAGDGPELARRIERDAVTVLQATPSTWLLLLEAGWRPARRTLRAVSGGEPLPPTVAAALGERVARLWNAYGPTETTVYSTAAAIEGERVTIGRPLANQRVYVLDGGLRPSPPGVPGEIFIGGAGVARGYRGQPAATARAFLPDPCAGPGQRMYRTGDVGRLGDDGRMEHLGRLDDQVKLRGHRIELGEIEAALARHHAVERAAAVLVGEGSPEARIVAFHTSATEIPEEELGELVRERLPAFMWPSQHVRLAALPLTPNRKLDRRALPALVPARSGRPTAGRARDAIEYQLVAIWEDVLGLRPVGVEDDFFRLGGHSLLAIRVMSRVAELTGRDLPLATLFEAPTVASLARVLRARPRAGRWPLLVPIQPRGVRAPLFCVHPIGGNVLWYAPLARALGDEQPFYGLQARGLDLDEAPHLSIEEMAAAYLAAVREVQPAGPYRIGGWSFGGIVAYEMGRRLAAAGDEVRLLALFDTAADDGRLERPIEREALTRLVHALELDHLLNDVGEPGDPATLGRLLEHAVAAGTLPPGFGLQRLARMYELNLVNFAAAQRYRPGPFAGTLTVFRAEDAREDAADPCLGWRGLARDVRAETFPGTHFDFLGPASVPVVAAALRRCLGP